MTSIYEKLLRTGAEFGHLLWTVLPYFVIGAVAGAALTAFVPERWTAALFQREKKVRSLFVSVTLAALLPGCSCATIPMAAGIKNGSKSSLAVITAFIFMSPLLSPMTIALTWSVLGWKISVARIIASFLGSLLLGATIMIFEEWFASGVVASGSKQVAAPEGACGTSCATTCGPELNPSLHGFQKFLSELKAILRSITPYFLLGMAIAAILSLVIPENGIPQILGGSSGPAAYILSALIGVPLYVCEGEEIPITYALIQKGLGVGPAFTFLLGSVGTCIPTMIMARKIIGSRAMIFYATYWFAFVVVAGFFVSSIV